MFLVKNLLGVILILSAVHHQVASARQLQCEYTTNKWDYWPTHKECRLYSVDLSEAHKSGGHSFSGSSSDKSEVSGVRFQHSKVVDFVPAELTREFPKLNALIFLHSNVHVVKTDFFGRDFKNLQLLNFFDTKVEAIEAGAFQELENLKNIYFGSNPLKTLPFGLFRNNVKLEIVIFSYNKISMIHPALFDDLKNLKLVNLNNNVCVNRQFGCETCTVSQSELKSELSTCFANCQADQVCSYSALIQEISKSTKTLKSELTSNIAQIDKKITNLESTCEAISKSHSTEIEKISNSLSLFIAKESNFMTDLQFLSTKNFEAQNFVIENATKALGNLFQDRVQKFEESNNGTAENLAGKIDVALQSMKTVNDELKAVVEAKVDSAAKSLETKVDTAINSLETKVDSAVKSNEDLLAATIKSIEEANQKLLETLQETILKATESRVDKAVELVDAKLANAQMLRELEKTKHALEKKELEEKMRTMEENFKQQMADFVKKQLKEFENKLREDDRP